jgi:phage terminase small subunit
MKLTAKQKRFVEEYLVDLNATQAAIRAGYSEHTAKVIAAENLTKPAIAEQIQAALDERSKRTDITADKVLAEIARLGFADPRKVFDDQGRLLPIHDLPDEVAASISSIEIVTTRVPGGEPTDVEHTAKIKFWDKRGSLELLGKHLKLFVDRVEHTGKNGGPVRFIIEN